MNGYLHSISPTPLARRSSEIGLPEFLFNIYKIQLINTKFIVSLAFQKIGEWIDLDLNP